MSTVTVTEPVVVLSPDEVEALRHLLGTVEDWLLHCCEEALDDLGEFLTGLGRAPSATPERLATGLVTDLGEHATTLRTALRRATERSADLETGPPA